MDPHFTPEQIKFLAAAIVGIHVLGFSLRILYLTIKDKARW